MTQRLKKYINPILFILIIAIGLRIVGIENNPPSLNWDEISHGYNAYSILKTGRDEWGKVFPIIFRAYGDYKLPVYIYLTVVSEAFLGLSVISVRLVSILAGVASVFFTYLLAKVLVDISSDRLFKKKINITLFPLLAALLMAVEPWSLFLSRGAFEANLSQSFIIAGVYYFLMWIRNSKSMPLSMTKNKIMEKFSLQKQVHNDSKLLIISSILFGLSVWSYNSARVFVPLLLISLILIFRREFSETIITKKTTVIYFLIAISLFFLPMFYQLLHPVGQARYSKVSIVDQGAINQIIEARYSSRFSPVIARAFHNKLTYFGAKFFKNYLSHFSPSYLFVNGGSQYQFSVQGQGLLYLINLPFFYIGILLLIYSVIRIKKKSIDKFTLLVFVWLILAPIPSSLTREAPHVLRSITLLPLPMLITSFGFLWTINKIAAKWRIIATVCYSFILFVLTGIYLDKYFNNYKYNYSWSWQYGYKEVIHYTKEHYNDYDKIIVTKKYGEPHEFFLFYWPWNPEKYLNDPSLNRFEQSDWFWVDGFDKFYFVNDWQVVSKSSHNFEFTLESGKVVDCIEQTRCLLITSPGNVSIDWHKLETINFLDGRDAFEIYKN